MTTNLNVRLDNDIKERAEVIFNKVTAAAIEEGKKMMSDHLTPRYSSMDDFKAALEV